MLGVGAYGAEVDADVAAKLFKDFAEVDAEILEDHADVAFVFEVANQTNDVLLVFRVRLVEFLQYLDLFKSCFPPVAKLVSQ